MSQSFGRRDFLKAGIAAGAGIGLMGMGVSPARAVAVAHGCPNAEKLGWRLGCQSYTFNHFTLFEAIDKNASLGLRYIEIYPGQQISKDITTPLSPSISADIRKQIKAKLADCDIQLTGFGVCNLPKDDCRATFDFAKDMGIGNIISEPAEDAFETLDKLCEEYKIHLAIHNHPAPSHYWNPDTVLKVCKGRSKWIGSCADTGHWMRSNLNPLECLKKLEGRIVSFHFKDLNKQGPDAHDVPWGTGKSDVKALLTEVHRQGIKAAFTIEYEYNWDNSVPEIAKCVAYFDEVAKELGA